MGHDAGISGRRIVVPETRELGQLLRMLEERGADAVPCPMIAIRESGARNCSRFRKGNRPQQSIGLRRYKLISSPMPRLRESLGAIYSDSLQSLAGLTKAGNPRVFVAFEKRRLTYLAH